MSDLFDDDDDEYLTPAGNEYGRVETVSAKRAFACDIIHVVLNTLGCARLGAPLSSQSLMDP